MIWLIPALIVAFVLLVWMTVRAQWSPEKRRKELSAVAEGLGWGFEPQATGVDVDPAFPLFNSGGRRQVNERLWGTLDGRPVEVFDYQYTVSTGQNRYTALQTVIHVEDPALALPTFSLRPENAVQRRVSVLPGPWTELLAHPEFSKRYALRGPDHAALRIRFNGPLAGVFESNRGLYAEGGNGHLYIYRNIVAVRQAQFPGWLEEMTGVLRAFYATAERTTPYPGPLAPPLVPPTLAPPT